MLTGINMGNLNGNFMDFETAYEIAEAEVTLVFAYAEQKQVSVQNFHTFKMLWDEIKNGGKMVFNQMY